MADVPRKMEINLAAIPVMGFGGLCMVAASLACAVALPPTRWFMIAAIGVGIVFGVGMILIKRIGDRPDLEEGDPPPVAGHVPPRRRSRGGLTTLGRLRTAHVW